jgi:S1-C subfamily serine protease
MNPSLRPLRFPLVAGLLAGVHQLSAAMPADELYQMLSPSVWQVITSDSSHKLLSSGSAVVIAADTLVTNCHVLKGAAYVSVRRANSTRHAELLHADTERDLCELAVPSLEAPAVKIAPEPPHVGQRILTIGSPRGLEATLSDGLVSALRRADDGTLEYIQISAPISPGSSGGGLFDEEGRLLGITTSGMGGVAQNLNFARPATMIAQVPQRATAALQRWRETKPATQAVAQAPAPVPVPAPAPVPVPAPQPPAAVAPNPPAPPAPPVAVATPRPPAVNTPRSSLVQPAPIASGYAALEDVDAVPYLSDRGRRGYIEYLSLPTPKAFAISTTGYWYFAATLRPRDPSMPADPSERALLGCSQAAKVQCKLYAVNGSVVWRKPEEQPAAAQTP